MNDVTAMLIDLLRNNRIATGFPQEKPDCIIGGQTGIPGSVVALCMKCGCTIYLIDGWKVHLHWPDIPMLCLRCATEGIDHDRS